MHSVSSWCGVSGPTGPGGHFPWPFGRTTSGSAQGPLGALQGSCAGALAAGARRAAFGGPAMLGFRCSSTSTGRRAGMVSGCANLMTHCPARPTPKNGHHLRSSFAGAATGARQASEEKFTRTRRHDRQAVGASCPCFTGWLPRLRAQGHGTCRSSLRASVRVRPEQPRDAGEDACATSGQARATSAPGLSRGESGEENRAAGDGGLPHASARGLL